jgi:uncharacterized protein YukJ
MPLKSYGVLKGRAVDRKMELEASSPHFQVHVQADKVDFRLAINVKSVQAPFDLLYFLDDNFKHPITEQLAKLNLASTKSRSRIVRRGELPWTTSGRIYLMSLR